MISQKFRSGIAGILAVAAALLLAARPATAGGIEPAPGPGGSLTGFVTDAETHEPLGWVTLVLTELRRGEIAHADGSFHFHDLPVGAYSLKASHVGYQTLVRPVTIREGDTLHINLSLTPTALQGAGVVIRAEKEQRVYEPNDVLSGERLQQGLGGTLAATLGSEAGVSQRTMGPAPARPVVRGLGGDRLLILQDGERTGDLSAGSSDHAVTLDPMTADRIEIIQGPAALLYSSNALGGVINLVDDLIARNLPDRIHGTVSLQGESIANGYSGGAVARGAIGPLALQLDGTARAASDFSTPAGAVPNTDLTSHNGSAGLSYVGSEGYIGVSGGLYGSEYGVPGGVVGAHPNGVRIVVDKSNLEGRGELMFDEGPFRRLEMRGTYTRYHHTELESNGSLGTEFGLVTTGVTASIHHDSLGPFERGTIGLWGEHRDFAAGGFTDVPPTIERSIAGFLYEEIGFGDLRLNAGLRYDYHAADPESSDAASGVRRREFNGFSGSLSLLYDLGGNFQAGATLMRTLRTPSVDELFTRGPHLASYTYEVGNPELGAENGLGTEITLRHLAESGHASLSLFRNAIDGYIYSRNTGDTNIRTLLPIYQATGGDAIMLGGELSLEYEILPRFVISTVLSHVEGTLRDENMPLPMIPPFNGKIGLRYQTGAFSAGISGRGAAAQKRTGEFEEPTAGYLLYDAFAQYRLTTSSTLHTIVLSAENLLNTEYRQHLSRLKSILPEAGRNVRLFYRLYF